MEFIVTKEEVDARSGAAKEMNSKRGLSTGYIYTPVYTYRSQALLLHEVATSNSTICAERTRSFIFHRRGGCTPIDAATNYPEICTHGAHHSLSLSLPSLSPLSVIVSSFPLVTTAWHSRARTRIASFFSSKVGRPFPSPAIVPIYPTSRLFVKLRATNLWKGFPCIRTNERIACWHFFA